MNPYAIPGMSAKISHTVIEQHVCRVFEVHPDVLRQKCRREDIVIPRQTIYYLCRKYLSEITVKQLGRMYNQDHATVVHAKKAIKNLIETKDKRWSKQIIASETILSTVK